MPTPLPCQLLIDPPSDGAWNMAVDEALLNRAAKEGKAALRFYQWSGPTLSLGYFQQTSDRSDHPATESLPAVRRLSGGGAILHDRELTYSLCLPANHPNVKSPPGLYRIVHKALLASLAEQNVNATMHAELASPVCDRSPETCEGFICFERRADEDVVLASPVSTRDNQHYKIAGSAQRRRRGAVLQHGSLLLSKSVHTSELPGVEELTGKQLALDPLIASWSAGIASVLDLAFEEPAQAPRRTAPQFNAEVVRLRTMRFDNPQWTKRR